MDKNFPISNIRNLAIIAHVDHGKTTLVDALLKQAGSFQKHQDVEDRVMDSMDLERERGITISAKNASFELDGHLVNIVDTPGHSDFGAEVERVLNMVDGAILLVDSSEGPLPQTRYVLKKALEQDLKIIVCINKIDRSDSRVREVENEILELFYDLGASEEQAEFPTVFAVGKDGWATLDPEVKTSDLSVLYDLILNYLPQPRVEPEGELRLLVANIGYNDYVGRLCIGRVYSGEVEVGKEYTAFQETGKERLKVSALFRYSGTEQVPVSKVGAGDIAIVAGLDEVTIGDTLAGLNVIEPLERLRVDEPTVGVLLAVNDGPFAGKEGKNVTSRKILERLEKELLHNVALRLEKTDRAEAWRLYGRGELQIAVLVEQMRREGFEFLVGKPQVVTKDEDGVQMEPMEIATVDVPEEHVGVVTEKLGARKGILSSMNLVGGRMRLDFKIPSRGLIGYRSEFMTDTRGTGLLNTEFAGYEPYKGPLKERGTGALIADRVGVATAYALYNLEERGRIMVEAGTQCYEGMIVGEHAKDTDLIVNVSREKKLTNVRASGTDDAIKLTPVRPLTVEAALEWIKSEEMIEVTPKSIRLRCRELNPHKRKK